LEGSTVRGAANGRGGGERQDKKGGSASNRLFLICEWQVRGAREGQTLVEQSRMEASRQI
jgi:hypothetical protein